MIESHPKSRRIFPRWLILCLVVVGVIGAVGGISAVYVLLTWQQNVQKQIKAIQAQGLPVSVSELDASYRIPAEIPDRTVEWTQALDSVSAIDINAVDATMPYIGSERNSAPLPGEAWNNLEEVRSLLSVCEKQIGLLREAASEEGAVRFPFDFYADDEESSPHTSSIRVAGRLLTLDAFVQLYDSNSELVIQDILAVLSLSKTLRYEPVVISQLVTCALLGTLCEELPRMAAHANWTESQLATLQGSINSLQLREGMALAFIGDRAATLAMIQMADFGVFQRSNEEAFLTLSEQAIASLANPWPRVIADMRTLEHDVSLLQSRSFSMSRYTGATSTFPIYKHAAISTCQSVAQQRCCIVGLAAHRFYLRLGRFPGSINEIDSTYYDQGVSFEEIRADPFDGQRLRMNVRSGEIVVYSIGKNERDDQGQGFNVDHPGDDDIAFRVFLAP